MTQSGEQVVRERFLAAVGAAGLRTSRSGVHRAEVAWASGPTEVTAQGVATRGRKVWNSWRHAQDSSFRFAIPSDWAEAVADRRLTGVDGRLTLWASPVGREPDGVEVFEVLWVEQGRGFALNLTRGYLARTPKSAHYAATVAAAIRGARRKYRHPPIPKPTRLPLAAEERQWGTVPIKLADALAFGLCEAGVRRWCDQVGIDPDGGPVTLSDIIGQYRARREPSVRRFVRRVVEAARSAGPAGSEAQPLAEGSLLVTAVHPVRLGPSS